MKNIIIHYGKRTKEGRKKNVSSYHRHRVQVCLNLESPALVWRDHNIGKFLQTAQPK